MLRGICLSIFGAFLLTANIAFDTQVRVDDANLAAHVFVDEIVNDVSVRSVGKDIGLSDEVVFKKPFFGLGMSQVYAQTPDFNIKTPALLAIQQRMETRFDVQLQIHFDTGALGFSEDGLVLVRDASAIAEKDRVSLHTALADENRDRKAVYREIAVANGHPEWEGQIRRFFAKQWVVSAKAGWWYQQNGVWHQK